MRFIILICAIFSLCSCGSAGKLLGGVARLPVRIIKSGVNRYNDDGAIQNAPIISPNDMTNLNDLN
ncbi:MAG: hypothetical protein COB14_06570 [Alphaproteobacteria bacterium]|nr:MAG: hypothetical protein COB14_06570 [Alphaproteobacteria bacterium]